MIRKIIDWFLASHRIHHLGLGILCGTLANDVYCLEYGAIGTAGATELKDRLWGGKADIVDFIITIIGFNIGYGLRTILYGMLN